MPGLMPDIHVFLGANKAWMAGTSPAVTTKGLELGLYNNWPGHCDRCLA
jgi:hypothetical protein